MRDTSAPRFAAGIQNALRNTHVPRWLVVTGLVVYCTACWIAIWALGMAGLSLIATASASQ